MVNKSGITLKGIDNPIVEDGGFSVIPDSNVIENIIIEGFDLRTGWGIHCFTVNDSMFLNNTITHSGWFSGILFEWSYNNTIMWNDILNSNCGIQLFAQCSNNTIIGNNISNNSIGINLIEMAGNNTIYHNNLIDNAIQANDDVDPAQWGENKWDNSYPSGGNYWNDYNGTDGNNDGIGDTPYNISGSASAQDRYPLVPVKGICGDLDGNRVVNIMDVRLLMNNVSRAGYPVDPWAGDVEGDYDIDGDDVWLLVRHVFDPDAYLLNCAIY